ncbi:MAG: hypothetical protein AAF664_08190 [Planctomycetota bacterium]
MHLLWLNQYPARGKLGCEITWLLLMVGLFGCDQPDRLPTSAVSPNDNPTVVQAADAASQTSDSQSFELYSTLTGKMARMEELLNGIDRLIDFPDFHARLITDAQEFQRLLEESRGLYPENLSTDDENGFDRTIDQTSVTSSELVNALATQDVEAARTALLKLSQQRQMAHARYSY